jgi:hypothetical protein
VSGDEKLIGRGYGFAVIDTDFLNRLGADYVFDTACSQASLDIGTDALRKGGCYYSFGFYHEAVSASPRNHFTAFLG